MAFTCKAQEDAAPVRIYKLIPVVCVTRAIAAEGKRAGLSFEDMPELFKNSTEYLDPEKSKVSYVPYALILGSVYLLFWQSSFHILYA
jgi:hypothetical protein